MNDAKNGSALVVMGVSGSGKTTVAELLAKQLGWPFMEGDRLHPPANVEKMRQGTPLMTPTAPLGSIGSARSSKAGSSKGSLAF